MLLRQKTAHLLPKGKALVTITMAGKKIFKKTMPLSGQEGEAGYIMTDTQPPAPLQKTLQCPKCNGNITLTFKLGTQCTTPCPSCNATLTVSVEELPWEAHGDPKYFVYMEELLMHNGIKANRFIEEGGSRFAEKYGVSHVETEYENFMPTMPHGYVQGEATAVFTINERHKLRATAVFENCTVSIKDQRWITPPPTNDTERHQIECAIGGFVACGNCYKKPEGKDERQPRESDTTKNPQQKTTETSRRKKRDNGKGNLIHQQLLIPKKEQYATNYLYGLATFTDVPAHQKNKCCICTPSLISLNSPVEASYRIIKNVMMMIIGDRQEYIKWGMDCYRDKFDDPFPHQKEEAELIEYVKPLSMEALLEAWNVRDPMALKALEETVILGDEIRDDLFMDEDHEYLEEEVDKHTVSVYENGEEIDTKNWYYDGLHDFNDELISIPYADIASAIFRIDLLYDESTFGMFSTRSEKSAMLLENIDIEDHIEDIQTETYDIAQQTTAAHLRDIAKWIRSLTTTTQKEADEITELQEEHSYEPLVETLNDYCRRYASTAVKDLIDRTTIEKFPNEQSFRQYIKTKILPQYEPAIWPHLYTEAWDRYIDIAISKIPGIDWITDDELGR